MKLSIEVDGFAMVEGLLSLEEVALLVSHIEEDLWGDSHRGGVRNLLDDEVMQRLAGHPAVRREVDAVLGRDARPVRGILFDKTEEANWKVPWHQDVTIAVNNRVEVEGYGPWSTKAGVLHVQPPAKVLEEMVSVRLHVDDCPAENGALKVVPSSHRDGKLSEREIQRIAKYSEAVTCAIGVGGALLMRPLLLHASSTAKIPAHRRVIHFDYAAAKLPEGMGWAAVEIGLFSSGLAMLPA